jgi:hypothetical protein
VASCVTCGTELHPERAEKYDYCTGPDCRARNARPRTIASIGVNKAADQFHVLDDRTTEERAGGRFRDAGRSPSGSLGHRRSSVASGPSREPQPIPASEDPAGDEEWSREEQNLALAFEITGRLPIEEIAKRLGRDQATVARMLVAAKAAWGAPRDA